MQTFKDKKIIITGGGSGIGKAIIREFYQAGARDFAVIGRKPERLKALEADFPQAHFILFQGDVSQLEAIRQFSQSVKDTWGAADILINNAGVVSAGALETISDEDIIAQQSINVTGLILLTKYALPLLKKSTQAAIINVSSSIALIGLPFYTPYAAAKGGVKMFSEALRRELKDFPIHVMTVYPTATDTPMMQTAAMGAMDTPELVAEKTMQGLNENAIDVILGDEQHSDQVRLNWENPIEFDKKAATIYDALAERTVKHRAM